MDFRKIKTTLSAETSHFLPMYSRSHTLEVPLSETTSSDHLYQDMTRSGTLVDSSCSFGNSASFLHHKENQETTRPLQNSFNQPRETKQTINKSYFQEQYWACAIPASLPPCPDRASSFWDPNKEYQDLLDYTYPLNSKSLINKDKEDDADPFFHDSGIDLDSYHLSNDSKMLLSNLTCQEKTWKDPRTNNLSFPFVSSTPLFKTPVFHQLRKSSESSDETSFEELSPYNSKTDIINDSILNYTFPKCSEFEKYRYLTAAPITKEKLHKSGQFIPTTKVLQLNRDLESDEEYLSLPPHLNELENLALQLKDISWSIGRNSSTKSNQAKATKQNILSFECSGQEGVNTKEVNETVETSHRASTFKSNLSETKSNTLNQIETGHTLKTFPYLRDMLDGIISSDDINVAENSTKVHENKSLVQIIQRFCHHLEKLLQWLYSISKIMEDWIPPKPDVESIQLSLGRYLKLKKDVSEHQPLADIIVKDGELLLKCMSLNSSVLKDTLVLISKQSEELEKHAERLYASVLEAMDTVTDDSL